MEFPITKAWLKQQLEDPGDNPPNFLTVGIDLYGEFLAEVQRYGGRSDQANRAAAVYGAHLRKFKASLKQKLTEDLVKALEIETSREVVRQLQYEVFRCAQASKDLKRFVDAKHSGWWRPAEKPPLPTQLVDEARNLLDAHDGDLKYTIKKAFGELTN